MNESKQMGITTRTAKFQQDVLVVVKAVSFLLPILFVGILLLYEGTILSFFGVTLPPESDHHNDHLPVIFLGGILCGGLFIALGYLMNLINSINLNLNSKQ